MRNCANSRWAFMYKQVVVGYVYRETAWQNRGDCTNRLDYKETQVWKKKEKKREETRACNWTKRLDQTNDDNNQQVEVKNGIRFLGKTIFATYIISPVEHPVRIDQSRFVRATNRLSITHQLTRNLSQRFAKNLLTSHEDVPRCLRLLPHFTLSSMPK